jgi:hypothetical protein
MADRSELDQWLKASEKQGELPVGTKITMQNFQQYKQFIPLGMAKMFEGQTGWKMPADAELSVGPTHMGNLPKTWIEATEKYGPQTGVDVLPNGHYVIKNYHGGTPFPRLCSRTTCMSILWRCFPMGVWPAPASSGSASQSLSHLRLRCGAWPSPPLGIPFIN